ncbi:InlB B-repeat-containing protein, partial [Acutalibacter caecimuris]|uniref:InlB B-repeat-containing protein n=1 Tax=Acutalibacter caecimuris TaxID=3093657 RepID=UPI002AC966CD
MTKFRKLGKRGLALFVALVLLVGMVPFSASALAAIPGFTPTDRFYANGKEVAQLYEGTYPNNPVYAYTNPPTTIVTKVGERGADQRLYTKSATCYCGNVLVEVTPDWIAVDENQKLTSSDTSIANPQNIDWKLEGYSSNDWQDADYLGYPALEIGVTGQTPGYSTLKFQTYQNYYYYYTWQRCNRCNQGYSEISFKGKWIEDTETINVTVNADYKLVYDAKGGSGSMNPTTTTVANTTASLKAAQNAFTAPAGMKFKEWNTEADGTGTSYAPGAPVTLDWEEGKGSTANPVTKTLYAIWEDDGPTKPDAPTREDLFGILHNFVKVKCVSTGDGLPHDEKTYSTWSNSTEAEAEVGTVTKNETTGKWECPVTLNSKVYAKMYALAPAFGVGETHELAQGQAETETITLTWDSEASKWKGAESKNTILATICVTCKPDPIPTTYTVVHEYYTNDTRDGSFTESFNGTVGDTVTADGITKVTDYQDKTYTYTSATPKEITLGTDDTITLRYDRDTPPPVDPDPATITVKWLNGYNDTPVHTATVDPDSVLTDGEFNIDEETGYLTGMDMDDVAIEYPADPTRDGYRFTGWGAPMWEEGSENTVITITAQWESTEPEPSPEEPTTPIKPPVVIVTPEPVATPTPSAEPTAEPTDDPGVDIPDPTQPPLGPGP